jgi:uncharacterized RDD family membrane protein YckC
MNCPVCDRELAPSLSICTGCGAMMNDSVREDLQTKVVPGVVGRTMTSDVRKTPPIAPPAAYRPEAMVKPQKRAVTGGLSSAKTSPTLVEFQSKNSALPDWRIHLQNAVQQRRGGKTAETAPERSFPTSGGAALKAEIVHSEPAIVAERISDPRVANAMKRIDNSRATFSADSAPKKVAPKSAQLRQYPFDVVPSPKPTSTPTPVRHSTLPPVPKPKLVVPTPSEAKRIDTNKLPLLDTIIERVTPIEAVAEIVTEPEFVAPKPLEFAEIKRIRIKAEHTEIGDTANELFNDEIEDLAPFSMRFGAGLFDLIIGAFATMLALAPFALNGENWFTTSGVLIAVGTWAVLMFVYMTICLGLLGRTLGMRLFSLELVDAVENEYPTLHQAAIHSSIFLLSLAFFGAGFLTMFFNEERRAAHDLLSGTILVREF